jgi:hypothetical protein
MRDALHISARSGAAFNPEKRRAPVGELRPRARYRRSRERGMALLVAVFALLLLSAAGMGMLYMTNTEASVAGNYRDAQTTYFDARAGLIEALSRLGAKDSTVTPTAMPTASNQQVIYIINGSTSTCPGAIQPWNKNDPCDTSQPNPYFDTELCHEGGMFPSGVLSNPGANYVTDPCTSTYIPSTASSLVPSASTWYQSVSSNAPVGLNYKWVRITLKANASAAPDGTNNSLRFVNGNISTTSAQVYWNPTSGPSSSGAETLTPGSTGTTDPVYMVTSLAVSPMNSRRMMQAEMAAVPPVNTPFPYPLEATSNQCNAISFGGNGYTDSFNSNNGPYNSAHAGTDGSIATFGGVTLGGNADINGTIYPGNTTISNNGGTCTGSGTSVSPGVTSAGHATCGVDSTGPCSVVAMAGTPPPTPVTPTLTAGGSNNTLHKSGSYQPSQIAALSTAGKPPNISITGGTITLSGGSTATNIYDLSISGNSNTTLILNSGVYNLNSLNITGQATLQIASGAVVTINICDNINPSPVNFGGGSIVNNTGKAVDLVLNYAGTGTLNMAGGSGTDMLVDAPNAAVSMTGNFDFFGAIIGNTVTSAGNMGFHYDEAINGGSDPPPCPTCNGGLMVNFREVMY